MKEITCTKCGHPAEAHGRPFCSYDEGIDCECTDYPSQVFRSVIDTLRAEIILLREALAQVSPESFLLDQEWAGDK